MAETLSSLRSLVYRRLGDRGFFQEPSRPSVAEPSGVDQQINRAGRYVLGEMESGGVRPLSSTSTIDVVSGTKEYDLETETGNQFRAHLFVLRTDTDKPLPAIWPKGGDFTYSEFVRLNGFLGGRSRYWVGNRSSPRLYRRGKYLGFIETPTEDQTLTLYYSPKLSDLALDGDSFPDAIDEWNELIVLKAADVLFGEENGPGALKVRADRAEELNRLRTAVQETVRVTRPARTSRWDQGAAMGPAPLNIP